MVAKLSVEELQNLLDAEFPRTFHRDGGYVIEEVWLGGSRVRKHFDQASLRPGGTIAGTTLMALTDIAMYVAILATIGWKPLTVTTNLNINFLRKGAPGQDLLAAARILKLGKRLAVGEVNLLSGTSPEPIAHVTSTYSIPNA